MDNKLAKDDGINGNDEIGQFKKFAVKDFCKLINNSITFNVLIQFFLTYYI